MFCIRIIIEPYHFVMLLEAEDTGLQFCLILSWPLLSREINMKASDVLAGNHHNFTNAIFTFVCNLEHSNSSSSLHFT